MKECNQSRANLLSWEGRGGMMGGWFQSVVRLKLSQPSLAGVGAGPELGQKKYESLDIGQSGSTLPTLNSSLNKNKFGQVHYCLPYLPIKKVWTVLF